MTHIKFNYKGKNYNFAIPKVQDSVERIEIASGDILFVVVVEMYHNLIKVYEVTEEFFDANILVHTQPVKKALLRASRFIEWYLSDEDTRDTLSKQIINILDRNGYINIKISDLFKSCGYIPSDICYCIAEEREEYDVSDLVFVDTYQDVTKFITI